MLSQLTSKLLSRRMQRDQRLAKTQAELVAQVADGKLTDADQILDQLETLGMTPDQLQDAVGALQDRRQLQETTKERPKVEKRQREIASKLETAKQAFLTAHALWQKTEVDLTADLNQTIMQLSGIMDAEQKLRGSAPSAAKDSADVVGNEMAILAQQREHLRSLLDPVHSTFDDRTGGQVFRRPTFMARISGLKSDIAKGKSRNAPAKLHAALPSNERALKKLESEKLAAHKELGRVEKLIAAKHKELKKADYALVTS